MTAEHQPRTFRDNPLLLGLLVFAGVVAVILLIVTALDWIAEDPAPPAQHLGVAPAEIRDNPEEYEGETVTISGQVNQVISAFAFTIGGEQWMNGGEILIIGPPPAVGSEPDVDDPLLEADIVQITGTVRNYDDIDFEAEFGEDIETDAMSEFQGQTVLVSEGTIVAGRLMPDTGDMVDTEDLASDPREYLNKRVTVDGEITDVLGDATFVLDGRLVVVDGTGTMTQEALEEADSAEISGEFVERGAVTEVDLNGERIDESALEGVEADYVLVAISILVLPESDAD